MSVAEMSVRVCHHLTCERVIRRQDNVCLGTCACGCVVCLARSLLLGYLAMARINGRAIAVQVVSFLWMAWGCAMCNASVKGVVMCIERWSGAWQAYLVHQSLRVYDRWAASGQLRL